MIMTISHSLWNLQLIELHEIFLNLVIINDC